MNPATSSDEFSQMERSSLRSVSRGILFNSGQLFVAKCESVSLVRSAVRRNAERIWEALYSTDPRLHASESNRTIRGEIAGFRVLPKRMRSSARFRSRKTREK